MAGKTEWEDALIKHGVRQAPVVGPTQEELETMDQENAAMVDHLAGKSLAELDQLEDEYEDDVIETYRRRRLAELQADALKMKYGFVTTISAQDFVPQVSEGSKQGAAVVCHLFARGNESCELFDQCMEQVAKKFANVKFTRILGSDAIRGFPDSNCPTILIYDKGDMKKQFMGINAFGGRKMTPDVLEWVLSEWGILKTNLETDPRDALFQMNRGKILDLAASNNDTDSDDDW